MKTIVITFFLVLLIPVKAQSVLTLDAGTSLGVLTTADLCAGIIYGSGILYGDGTICGGLVSTGEVTNEMPLSFEVFSNYPNPFNPVTKIRFGVPENSLVKISVYDALGKSIETLVNENLSSGSYEVQFDGSKFAAGVYYCRMTSTGFSDVKKLILLK